MIEIPSAENPMTKSAIFTHIAAESIYDGRTDRAQASKTEQAAAQEEPEAGHDYTSIALLAIAAGCGIVLIHTLAQALGGGFWNHLIATGFEATPIALVGAKISDGKTREKALWGAVLLFGASLILFTSPQVTSLLNELSSHEAQSKTYALDLQKYESSQAMVERARNKSDRAEADYNKIVESEGERSTRANQAKREADKAFASWERLSKDAAARAVKPTAPGYSKEFVSAMQTIVLRIGLFMAAFLSMYVRRRLA